MQRMISVKLGAASEVTPHLLPCKVEGAGDCCPARVEDFFTPTIREEPQTAPSSDKIYSASFRGRPLRGSDITLPEGFTGIVMKDPHQSPGSTEAKEFEVTGRFSRLRYWNLQTPPTADDRVMQAMTWPQLACSLHTPLPVSNSNSSNSC